MVLPENGEADAGTGDRSRRTSSAQVSKRSKCMEFFNTMGRECKGRNRTAVCNYVLDLCHVTRYNMPVIKTFKDRHTQQVFETGKSKRLPADLLQRARRRLEYVDLATCLDDLKMPPSNHLHALTRDRAGQHSISINDQWRICFRFDKHDAYDVEITDYH